MIIFNNVSKQYENMALALNCVTLKVPKGQFVSVVGRSGSGKTTLMNLIGNLDYPTSGQVIVNDIDLASLTHKESAKYRLLNIGFIFQSFHLEPRYTVAENVEMPLLIAGLPAKERKQKVFEALEHTEISHKAKEYANTLSGGEKQRACIARALVNSAKILLADEPCGNLDAANALMIMKLLKNLHQSGKTVILVTHNAEDAKMSQRRITLLDGRVLSDES